VCPNFLATGIRCADTGDSSRWLAFLRYKTSQSVIYDFREGCRRQMGYPRRPFGTWCDRLSSTAITKITRCRPGCSTTQKRQARTKSHSTSHAKFRCQKILSHPNDEWFSSTAPFVIRISSLFRHSGFAVPIYFTVRAITAPLARPTMILSPAAVMDVMSLGSSAWAMVLPLASMARHRPPQ